MLAKGKKKPGANKVAPGETIEQSQNDVPTNINDFLINPNIELPAENIIISIQGKTILSEKNVCVISGKPKSRKSVIAHSIISSAISGKNILGIEANTQKNVVLIDTEQSQHDLLRSINRLKQLAELKTIPNQLKIYSVRQLNVEQIKAMLKLIAQDASNQLIVIDGALDLINNINDVEESKQSIDIIKQLLVANNIALVMVIHQAKSTNFTIGHFGSYFDRFAQSVLSIEKTESGTSKIASAMMRSDADFKPYEFYWNFNINNYCINWTETDEILLNSPGDWPATKHFNKMELVYKNVNVLTYQALIVECSQVYQKSQHWCKKLIKHLFDIDLLIKVENGIKINTQTPF
jgi:KaiC/GvpD/RAD55 family RecA-like ATPase